MNNMHYLGLDIHKKTISYCIRQFDGTILQENTIAATRPALEIWMRQLPQPWTAGMEATMFTGWIYDHLGREGSDGEGGALGDAESDCGGKEKERSGRCSQDGGLIGPGIALL